MMKMVKRAVFRVNRGLNFCETAKKQFERRKKTIFAQFQMNFKVIGGGGKIFQAQHGKIKIVNEQICGSIVLFVCAIMEVNRL
jgi:hypothetical protein